MSRSLITSSRCNDCGRVIIPPRETCPYCGKNAGHMELMELPNRGVVQSYTTLHMPPEGFEAPLSLALVELEHGALILSVASDQSASPLKIGDSVKIEIDSEGKFHYRPVN
jgi:uncharacterized OB-fold protein